MYLTGSKKHTLDQKVRLTLPSEIRREFKDTIKLVPSFDALYGFSPEGYKTWVESFFPEGYNPRNPKDVALRRKLNGSAVTVDIDSAGRIALGKVDASFREKLGISGDVIVVGNDDHFEIWNEKSWNAAQSNFDGDDLYSLMFGDKA